MILRNTTSQPPGWTNLHTILYEHKGMESPLPYLSPLLKGHKLLAGANFASAGIGILNDTEVQFTNTVCLISFFGTITSAVKYNLYMETTRVYFEQYHTQLVDIIGAYGSRQLDHINTIFQIMFAL
uniref:GDSL esterase/lipase At5g33370-like n=1 Tax=Tanacetum cinerariifolium TaxID=118510 RepID=A0A6L2LK14_TANCI|nr:GDSL esterase/lipase At5g33370-like [Tanacetum cinerariifolium]